MNGRKHQNMSEVYLAVVYGIEGLCRYQEGNIEYEEWLDLFRMVNEELDGPVPPNQDIMSNLDELAQFAEKVKSSYPISDEEWEDKIELAKEVRDSIDDRR